MPITRGFSRPTCGGEPPSPGDTDIRPFAHKYSGLYGFLRQTSMRGRKLGMADDMRIIIWGLDGSRAANRPLSAFTSQVIFHEHI